MAGQVPEMPLRTDVLIAPRAHEIGPLAYLEAWLPAWARRRRKAAGVARKEAIVLKSLQPSQRLFQGATFISVCGPV